MGQIQNSWRKIEDDHSLQPLCRKIHTCKEDLKKWNRNVFGHLETELRKFLNRTTSLQGTQITSLEEHELQELHKQYGELLKRQAILWGQKSRIFWLKYGDKNTFFFFFSRSHCKMSSTKQYWLFKSFEMESGLQIWMRKKPVSLIFTKTCILPLN